MKIFGKRGLSPIVSQLIWTVAARKKSWFASISVILAIALIGAGISGCDGSSVVAKVFVGDGGELYIDIPEAQKHKHAVLYGVGVYKAGSLDASGIYWSIIKSGYSSNADVTALPLRYGASINGLITEFPARKLENGTYYIRGFIKFFDSDELEKVGTPFDAASIAGRFAYENGTVGNIPN